MPEWHMTSAQRALLNEFDLGKLFKKAGINKKASGVNSSGNLETPAKKPRHRKFMGQDPEGRGTMSDKPGRPEAENVHAEPTPADDPSGLTNLGGIDDILKSGLSGPMSPDGMAGDDASLHPNKKHKPTRLQGPAENPGAQTYTSFGNRYPGARHV